MKPIENLRRILSVAAIICATLVVPASATAQSINLKATDMLQLMTPGWNLGNTLDAGNPQHNFTNDAGLGSETAWQQTVTTKETIDYVKGKGFRSVRLPVAWVMGHVTDSTTCTIDRQWMDRIQQVVDYCVANDLYVILNDHWDGGWLENSFKKDISEEAIARNCQTLKALWTQIANRFRDYDGHLLFAGLNEPEVKDAEQTTALLRYEQAFIDAVRATGGNNAQRILIIQAPSTDIDKAEALMKELPKDNIEGKLMVEVHYYTPYQFTLMDKDADWGKRFFYWGKDNHVVNTANNATREEEDFVRQQFMKMKTLFVDRGYPVLLGEYGANWRDVGTEGGNQEKHDASVKDWYRCVTTEAVRCGMIPVVWDINYPKMGSMTLIDRERLLIHSTPAYKGIREGLQAVGMWK